MHTNRKLPWILVLMLAVFGLCPSAFADTQAAQSGYTIEQLGAIAEAQACLRGGEKLRQIAAITEPQLNEGAKKCLGEINAVLGTSFTREQILEIETGNMPNLTALQRAAGHVNWHNTVWFFAVLGIGVCVCVLFWRLGLILVMLPKELYELAGYLGGGALIYHAAQSPVRPMESLLGALLVMGGLILSKVRMKEKFKKPEIVIPTIMTAVFAIAAMTSYSSIIGYFAVASALAALGFSIIVLPGVYLIGYNEDDAVARGTFASFALLGAFMIIRLTGTTLPYVALFADGVWLVAGIVGFIGLLIMSNRWFWKYHTRSARNESPEQAAARRQLGYVMFQIIMVGACVLGLWFGSTFQVGAIQKIAGTFLVLWVLEKPFEIAVESITYYAIAGLGVFGTLYWLCTATASRPEALQLILPF